MTHTRSVGTSIFALALVAFVGCNAMDTTQGEVVETSFDRATALARYVDDGNILVTLHDDADELLVTVYFDANGNSAPYLTAEQAADDATQQDGRFALDVNGENVGYLVGEKRAGTRSTTVEVGSPDRDVSRLVRSSGAVYDLWAGPATHYTSGAGAYRCWPESAGQFTCAVAIDY